MASLQDRIDAIIAASEFKGSTLNRRRRITRAAFAAAAHANRHPMAVCMLSVRDQGILSVALKWLNQMEREMEAAQFRPAAPSQ
jgi:hypothetical protein